MRIGRKQGQMLWSITIPSVLEESGTEPVLQKRAGGGFL